MTSRSAAAAAGLLIALLAAAGAAQQAAGQADTLTGVSLSAYTNAYDAFLGVGQYDGMTTIGGRPVSNGTHVFVARQAQHRVLAFPVGKAANGALVRSGPGFVVAGVYSMTGGYGGDGGPATAARLNSPSNLALSSKGVLFIADSGNNRVRRVDLASGVITTVAGSGACALLNGTRNKYDFGPFDARTVPLCAPSDVALDDVRDRLYIAEPNNNRVRKLVLPSLQIVTFAGPGPLNPPLTYTGDGGAATDATLWFPGSIQVAQADPDFWTGGGPVVYIADGNTQVIRKVNSQLVISTVAGKWRSSNSDSNPYYDTQVPTAVSLVGPRHLAVDPVGGRALYFVSGFNVHVLRWYDPPSEVYPVPAPSTLNTLIRPVLTPTGQLRVPLSIARIRSPGGLFLRRADAAYGTGGAELWIAEGGARYNDRVFASVLNVFGQVDVRA